MQLYYLRSDGGLLVGIFAENAYKKILSLANHPQKCYNIFIIYHQLPYAAAKSEVLFMMLKEIAAEAERGEYTEFIYDTTCFG